MHCPHDVCMAGQSDCRVSHSRARLPLLPPKNQPFNVAEGKLHTSLVHAQASVSRSRGWERPHDVDGMWVETSDDSVVYIFSPCTSDNDYCNVKENLLSMRRHGKSGRTRVNGPCVGKVLRSVNGLSIFHVNALNWSGFHRTSIAGAALVSTWH